ncbi:putative major facilitator superfamily [Phaeomoniella chlamydospora]|uniref:Putative major facilitator superfamily n=1 Tax=Phaeomoniella chlamydospora TaxID=158046 RepID=A0A0G2G2S7_PHACM|nr:putative major facilitator superfamily [Phaeomoniella chlamydospora]
MELRDIKQEDRGGIVSSSIPYTTFTNAQIRILTLLLGLATITSPLTATIYFPLLTLLREHFHTSTQNINLSMTIYVIFQAISPAIFGPLSDTLGRRPVYLFTLSIYCAGNIGLALNKTSYSALLILRALQSLGASAAYSISYGVVADICVPSKRGRTMGQMSMALNLGACIGPVVGGLVAYKSGSYEWVFWSLVVVGGVLLAGIALLLPETARNIVGNGAYREASLWEEAWWKLGRRWLNEKRVHKVQEDSDPAPEEMIGHRKGILKRFRINNPLAYLRMLFYYDTALTLWIHGSFYLVDYSLIAAIPDIYEDIYGFNELQIGLAYLPRGVGIIVGGYCLGKAMDYNYCITAKNIGWKVDRVAGDDLSNFPIERARSRGSIPLLVLSTAALCGYGWAVAYQVHFAVAIVIQFLAGFWLTCFYTIYSTLLVDIFPDSPSTAAAAASIVRCALAAGGLSIVQPILDVAGRGWYFTALGLSSGTFGALAVLLIRRYGMKWRQKRHPPRTENSADG